MKKKKLIVISVLSVAVIAITAVFCLTQSGLNSPKEVSKEATVDTVDISEMKKQGKTGTTSIGNESFSLELENKSGQFVLTDIKSGKRFYSSPYDMAEDKISNGLGKQWLSSQLLVRFYNDSDNISDTTSQTSCVKKNGLSVYSDKEKICCVYNFVKEKFEISVVYSLNSSGISVTVPLGSIKENGKSKITAIKLLPYFSAVSMSENGFLFVPDGCGAVIELTEGNDNLSKLQYEKGIYGRDSALSTKLQSANKQDLLFPVFASCSDSGIIGTVTEGDAVASLQILGEGYYTGYNTIVPICTVRSRDTIILYEDTANEKTLASHQDEMDYKGNFTVEYSVMSSAFTYTDIAEKTAERYKAESDKTKSSVSDKNLYLYTVGVTQKKENRFGILQDIDYVLTDFSEAVNMLNRLNKSGIDNTALMYYGVFGSGEYTTVPTDGKLNGKVESGSTDALFKGNSTVIPMIDLVRVYNSGGGISDSKNVCRGIRGTKSVSYPIALNLGESDKKSAKSYSVLRPTYLNSLYENVFASMNKYGIKSLGDSGVSVLSSDFTKKKVISRQDSLEYYTEILKENSDRYSSYSTDSFYGYMLPYVTDVTNLPMNSSGISEFSYDVPFAQLVVSRFANYCSLPLNEISSSDKVLMKLLEYNSIPSYYVMSAEIAELKDTLLQDDAICGFDDNFDEIEKIAKQYIEFKQKASGTLSSNSRVSAGVYLSTYQNGARVVFNYNDSAVLYNGIEIKPQSYEFVR